MFNLINSQVYELQQQESLLLFEKQHQQNQNHQQQQQQQQQIQLQQFNLHKNKNNKKNNCNNTITTTCITNIDTNSNNNGIYNCKSLNNLTNYLNINSNNSNNNSNNNNNGKNNSDTINRKNKSNYGSYYRQEKLKATANFIEKFLKSETTSSIATATKEQQQRQKMQQQQQQQQQQKQQQKEEDEHINDENKHICYTPTVNFTYTYQKLDPDNPGDKNTLHTKNNIINNVQYINQNDRLKFNCNNSNNNYVGSFNEINNDNELDINSDITGELGQPNSLQLEHLNNLLDKNSSDTMPSLSPSQSSTDQSTSTQTTNATISSNNNSLSSNGSNVGVNGIRPEIKIKRILKKSSFNINDDHTTQSTTAATQSTTTDRTIKKSTNNTLNTVLHRKKLLQVVSFLDQQNQRLEKELQNEKVQRNEELSRIVKSLLYFEAKLKSEKKVINQKLYDKDDEIARLIRMNRSLKEKLNEKEAGKAETQREAEVEGREGVEEIADESSKVTDQLDDQLECKYPESLYCSNCRKEYYGLNEKCDNWTQTSGKITDCRSNLKGENNNSNNNQINNNSTEHCSSSDETLSSSFYGARRSVRYTSKRTFGTFREYMRSRCMNIDDTNIDTNHNLSEDEQRSTLSRDEYPSHSSSNTSNSYNKKDKKTFSSKMERIHGVKRQSSFEFDSSEAEMRYYRKNFSSSGPETDLEHTNSPNDEGIEEDDDENDYDEDDIDDYDDNHLGNDIYRGVNVGVLTTTPLQSPTTTSATVNSKEFSEISVKQDFETSTDDWYASASDADDDQNTTVCRTKSYGYNAVNPVLECVNQILLQQSMEECINEKMSGGSGGGSVGSNSIRENHYDNSCNGPMSLESNDNIQTGNFSVCSGGSGSKDTHTNSNLSNGSNSGGGSRKRVHFSTKNSMVHVPRDDDDITEHKSCSFSDTINSSIQSEHHSNNLNYESIYSNEYEPIGSENNSSNLYVDMESKLDPDERINLKSKQQNQHNHQQHQHQQQQQQSQNKQPPALPPKPANLIKFKRVNKIQQPTSSILSHRNSIDLTQIHSTGVDSSEQQPSSAKLTKELLEKIDCDKSEKYGSEPDYCSISEVNVAIKTMQIVAEVHKSNDTNSSSSVISVLSGDNSDAMSQKTSDDTEEIFADIPKLPNVAAIIAPSPKNKSPKCNKESLNKNDSGFIQSSISLQLQQKQNHQQQQFQQHQQNQQQMQHQQQQQRPQTLQLYRPKSPGQVQRKHVPNILAEINKKIQQANITSATTATASLSPTSPNKINSNFNLLSNHQTKRKPTTNQLLPILKSSTSSTSNVGSCIINSKNFNNILLSTQTINNPICKSLKNCDTIKFNQQQQQQKISSPTNLKQQQFLNQMQSNSNAKLLHNKNKQNQLLQHQQHQLSKIEDSSLEAEFDWYNLDAEYGKSTTNRPDIVKAADVLNSCLDEYILTNSSRADRLANDINQSIEYNLDEEFSLSNQPDIIKENLRLVDDRKLETIPGSESESNESSLSTSSLSKNLILDQYQNQRKAIDEQQQQQQQQSDDPESCSDENVDPSELKELNLSLDNKTHTKDTKTINDNNTLTVVNKFPTICDQTPCRKTVNIKQKNFVEFIDSAGLSTKSLPQQKKIYFTGPFV